MSDDKPAAPGRADDGEPIETVGSTVWKAPEPPAPMTKREEKIARRSARKRHPLLRGLVLGLVTLLVVAVVASLLALRHFNGNIQHVDLNALRNRPSDAVTVDPVTNLAPMNILLMGSDTRAGVDSEYGDPTKVVGARSDVTMIAHLAADRKSAVIVSIPRDTMVKGPKKCDLEAPTDEWVMKQFNDNFSQGGAACTIKVVEEMTGLYIDHVATVDFTGFKDMVDALGTVEVCLTAPVKDGASGANFPAGRQKLDGEQALAFVRLRHTGDGSDIGRIKRQQDFLSSMIREAMSAQLLTSPTRTYQFLDAATKSLSTDPDFASVTALASVANSLRTIETQNIRFVSMPWEPYVRNAARVQPSSAAEGVWKIMREDSPWPTPSASPSASGSASASAGSSSAVASTSALSPSASTTIAGVLPTAVNVGIVNASGKEGLGTQTAAALKAQGFKVVGISNAAKPIDGVVIHYAPKDAAKAKLLAAAFDGAVLKADGAAGDSPVVHIGRGASKVKLVPNAPSTATLPAQPMTAPPATTAVEVKTADTDICSDTGSK